MAGGIGSHQLQPFPNPAQGIDLRTLPIFVRGNDNAIATAYNAHDADGSIHLGSGSTATVNASHVTPGTFNAASSASGNYLFPALLTVNGLLTPLGGVFIDGPKVLNSAEASVFSFETPVTRYYIGDGTGYSLVMSKRVGSVTTDYHTFTDSGAVMFGGAMMVTGSATVQSVVLTGQPVLTTGMLYKSVPFGVTVVSATGSNYDFALLNPAMGAVPILAVPTGTRNVLVTGALLSSSAKGGVGYATGAGGTVVQATSKATAFTLNTASGKITFASSLLLPFAATSSATWTNSALASGDVVVFQQTSGSIGAYTFNAITSAGQAQLVVANVSSVSLIESPAVNFAVIKAVPS